MRVVRSSEHHQQAIYTMYTIHTNNDDKDGTTKTECKCKCEIACTWYPSFVPWTSTRAPKEFIFMSLKNSKEILLNSNIQIFEISPRVWSV